MKSNKVTRGILALFVMMLFCFAFKGVASASQGYDGVATTMGHSTETIRVMMINSSGQTVNLRNPYGWAGTNDINRTTLGFSQKGPNPASIDIAPQKAKSFELAFNGFNGGFDLPIAFNGSANQNVRLSIRPTYITNTGAIAEFAVHLLHAALDIAEIALEPGDPLAIFGLVKNVMEMSKEATDFGDSTTFSMIMANNGSILKSQDGVKTDGQQQPGWQGTGVYWVYGFMGHNHRIAVVPAADLNGGYGFPEVALGGNQGMIFDITGGTSPSNDPTGKGYATLIITIYDDPSFTVALKKYNTDQNGNLGFTWDLRNCHPKTTFDYNLPGTRPDNGPFFWGDNDGPTAVTVNAGAKMSVLANANGMTNSGTVIFRNFTPFNIQAFSQIMPMNVGPGEFGSIWADNNGGVGLAANGGQAAYPFGFSKNDPNYF